MKTAGLNISHHHGAGSLGAVPGRGVSSSTKCWVSPPSAKGEGIVHRTTVPLDAPSATFLLESKHALLNTQQRVVSAKHSWSESRNTGKEMEELG